MRGHTSVGGLDVRDSGGVYRPAADVDAPDEVGVAVVLHT